MKKLGTYFFQGLIATMPIVLTGYLLYIIFIYVDNLIPFGIPGLGLLAIIVGITIIGIIVNYAVRTPLYSIVKRTLDRLPLIKVVFNSIRDLLSAFVGKEKKFEHPVRVLIDKDNGLERLGFITQQNLSFIDKDCDKIAVYLPSSYGILGELYFVPKESVIPINAKAAEVMKFIISGGVSKISISNATKKTRKHRLSKIQHQDK